MTRAYARVDPNTMVGGQYGRWRAVRVVKGQTTLMEVECECGTTGFRKPFELRNGSSKSCGCLSREVAVQNGCRNADHSLSRTVEYTIWSAIKGRCYNQRHVSYPYYGGRGIRVADVWLNDPARFIEDMGTRPPGMTIERRDSRKDYSPENCYWAPREVQANNRSNTVRIEYGGVTRPLSEWAEVTGIKFAPFLKRYRAGLPPADVLADEHRKTGPRKKT